MGGQALPWEYDPELEGKLNTKPSENRPANPYERSLVHHYRTLRARIHDGPFYAILSSSARDEDKEEEDPDQFDEEDEDDNDDYNAEQYFDGGDDDEMGDEGGGDDDY
ncbi:unnamed protein product [Aureobasidium pullulans]|nr:unnamed protein product [Aureobasidium pullulans]